MVTRCLKTFTLCCSIFAVASWAGNRDYLGSRDLRTLRSAHINLHFDIKVEDQARVLLPQMEDYLSHLLLEKGLTQNQTLNVYLVSTFWDNAVVYYPAIFYGTHMLLPLERHASASSDRDQLLEGDAGTAMGVFTHEIMHYVESDQHMPFWLYMMGDGILQPSYNPSWKMEAWAVFYQSEVSSGKRNKESLFGALTRSGIAKRSDQSLRAWDLSSSNKEWKPVGAQYVVGTRFYDFLAKKYGTQKLDQLNLGQGLDSKSLSFGDIYQKSFAELWKDFNESLHREPLAAATTAPVTLDVGDGTVQAMVFDAEGHLWFDHSSPSYGRRYVEYSPANQTTRLARPFRWWAPFLHQTSNSPLAWISSSKPGEMYYFANETDAPGLDIIPGIYHLDLKTKAQYRVQSLPGVVAATYLPESKDVISLKPKTPGANILVLRRNQQILAEFSGFTSAADLQFDLQSKRFFFSASNPEKTWDIYSWSESEKSPRVEVASVGEDLIPQLSGGALYFLSDMNGRSFQVYRRQAGKLCRISNEPYIIRSFAVSKESKVFAASRVGQNDYVVEINSSECFVDTAKSPAKTIAKDNGALGPKVADTSTPLVEESAWTTFIPKTRAILPFWASGGGGWFVQAELAGSSPYFGWTWGGYLDYSVRDLYVADAQAFVSTAKLYPLDLTLSTNAKYSVNGISTPDTRFLENILNGVVSSGHHTWQLQLLNYQKVSGVDLDYNTMSGFGAKHSFSNFESSVLAGQSQRGWQIESAALVFPNYLEGDASATLLEFGQVVALPVDFISPIHSFTVALNTAFGLNRSVRIVGNGETAFRRKYFIEPDNLEDEFAADPVIDRNTNFNGHPDVEVWGKKSALLTLSYMIPLNFMSYGFSHIFDRPWLSPESSPFYLRFVYQSAFIDGIKFYYENASKDSRVFSSVSSILDWKLSLNENKDSYVALSYIATQDLNAAKKFSNLFRVAARLAY